jgi:hypothetical protein
VILRSRQRSDRRLARLAGRERRRPADAVGLLGDAAELSAAGLVRGWVLQGVAAEREGSVEQTVEALSRDVARLRRQLTGRQAS